MRCGRFVLLALLTFTVTAGAQAQVVVAEPPMVLARVSADDVVARLLSFDRNDDGRVDRAELAERMHNTLTRGDVDRDGALDRAELLALANTPPQAGFPQAFGSSIYGFADEASLSSRLHIDGALDDLRLAGPVRDRAAVIVKDYVDTLEVQATADLLQEMAGLLSADQLADFKAAVETQLRGRAVSTFSTAAGSPRQQVVFRGVLDAGRRIEGYALPPDRTRQANAAFTAYKNRLRLGVTERAELLARMSDVLSVEERDDLRAALERRPVVQKGGFVVGGVVGGIVAIAPVRADAVRSGIIPAILRTPAVR